MKNAKAGSARRKVMVVVVVPILHSRKPCILTYSALTDFDTVLLFLNPRGFYISPYSDEPSEQVWMQAETTQGKKR